MAVVESIIRGVDKEIEFTITDINGVPIDPSTLVGIVIELYFKDRSVLVKFSKNTKAGFSDVITGYDDSNGKVKIKLESDVTASSKLGSLFAELKIQTTNIEYENDTFNDAVTEIEIGTIVDGVTKSVNDLA